MNNTSTTTTTNTKFDNIYRRSTFLVKFKLGIDRRLYKANMALPSIMENRGDGPKFYPMFFEAMEEAKDKIKLLWNPDVIVKIKSICLI